LINDRVSLRLFAIIILVVMIRDTSRLLPELIKNKNLASLREFMTL